MEQTNLFLKEIKDFADYLDTLIDVEKICLFAETGLMAIDGHIDGHVLLAEKHGIK